eukprot:3632316-Pyramimonas_sp.AAC.1
MVFTDGSCILGDVPRLRSAGWSVVVLSKEGAILAEAWGAVPPSLCPPQTARAGEDYAAVVALTEAIGNYQLLVDCKGT